MRQKSRVSIRVIEGQLLDAEGLRRLSTATDLFLADLVRKVLEREKKKKDATKESPRQTVSEPAAMQQ